MNFANIVGFPGDETWNVRDMWDSRDIGVQQTGNYVAAVQYLQTNVFRLTSV